MKQQAGNTLEEWRQQTISQLCGGLQILLDHAGDVLVDFASRSENMIIQTEFFDAQRELFLKGGDILPMFRSHLQEDSSHGGKASPPLPGEDTLSLLDKDDYDLSVALDTIADNCAKRNKQNLHALQQRLSALSGGRRVSREQIPLNPHQVTEAFQYSSEGLEINKRVQLVLFTLFDRYVVSHLDEAFGSVNLMLADSGVLPTIHYDIVKHAAGDIEQGATGSDPPATETGTQTARPMEASAATTIAPANRIRRPPTTDESLRAISNLLSSRRQRNGGGAFRPASPQESEASARHLRQALEAPGLTEPAAPAVLNVQGDKMVVDKQLLLRVREALTKQRQLIQSLTQRKQLGEREQDLVEIVGMLFEAILDDDNIPVAVKTLLTHLHTPFLKIAAHDPEFLHGQSHPARELLDDMLRLGVRWVDANQLRRGIFPTLQYCVRKIVDNPLKVDFPHLKSELASREQQLRQSKQLTEKRTLEAEQGQALLARSRDTARSAVHTLLAEHRLPPQVRMFLQTVFTDYLSLLLLRNDMNPRHPRCKQALNEAITLIGHVANGDIDSATHAATALRKLITDLLPHYEARVDEFIDQLQSPLQAEDEPTPPPSRPEPEHPTADELLALEISAGSWLRWQPSDQEEAEAIKLVWTNPHTHNMLFVDRNGAKAAQLKAIEVSAALRDGSMKELEPGAQGLLDNLLEGIRRRLQPEETQDHDRRTP